ncbi:MAG: ABC transporter ATP-binding protein [Armatimonadota bacterium]|nr:ABC transporter ATP-binding protein [Armatimonadota bacterium]
MNGAPILELRDLQVAYGDQRVVWGVSLEVRDGEVVAVIGPNGAGKTTTLLATAGLLRPLAGQVTFLGARIDGLPPHTIVDRGLALVPEGRRLFGAMTVRENLLLGGYPARARRDRAATLAEVMDLFPVLAARAHQRAGTLSGGEQQMLAIGRALMARPRLLLLDEPSLGLAPRLVRRVFELVREIAARGVTVVVVEQNAFQALEHADRAYVLSGGRVAASGPARELLARDEIRRTYVGL